MEQGNLIQRQIFKRQIFEYNDVLGYRFIPNVKVRIQHESGGYLLQTNNCGFRCKHNFLASKKTILIAFFYLEILSPQEKVSLTVKDIVRF